MLGVIRGAVTPNEGRAILGLPPVTGGDVLYVPSGASVQPITEEDGTTGRVTNPAETYFMGGKFSGLDIKDLAYAERLLQGRAAANDYATKFLADRHEALATANGHKE